MTTNARSDRSPLISVVICTLNRAGLLERALTSIAQQDFPIENFEVVIVDNGSTDHTAEVVRQFSGKAEARYIREERLGLCIARNTGWRASTGRYIAFFDDDAIASPGWLAAIRDGFASGGSTVGVVGGPARPLWERPRPAWLADEIACSLTIVDWGPSDKLIDDVAREWLVGANMAVPRSLLVEVGGFHPWLDRVGNNLLSSGDVFLQREIVRRGYRCLYRPSMVIGHLAPISRLNQRWFLRRYFWQGVSDAVIHLIEHDPSMFERVRLASARMGDLLSSGRLSPLFARTDQPNTFTAKCFARMDIGFAAGMLGAAGH